MASGVKSKNQHSEQMLKAVLRLARGFPEAFSAQFPLTCGKEFDYGDPNIRQVSGKVRALGKLRPERKAPGGLMADSVAAAETEIRQYVQQLFGVFADLVGIQTRARPRKTALICGGDSLTYRQLDEFRIASPRACSELESNGDPRSRSAQPRRSPMSRFSSGPSGRGPPSPRCRRLRRRSNC